MRVLHLIDRLSDRGGAYWHAYGVLRALAERGHQVQLAVGVDDGQVVPPCPVDVVPGLEARGRVSVDLDSVADRFRPDRIHVHTVVNPAVLEWAAERDALVTVQDHRCFCPARGKWTTSGEVCRQPLGRVNCAACFDDREYFEDVYALTQDRLAALHDLRVIVLSRYMRSELLAAGVPEARVHVVPPFVDGLDQDADSGGSPCVLLVGRLTAGKGALDAVAAWRSSHLDLPLVAAGTGPLRAALEAGGATVLGWVDRRRLSALYRRAVVVVMPSRWQEPFGISGLEAVTMGAPVAAWDSGGVSEWHTGPGLTPWGDVDGLARALQSVAGSRVASPAGFERDVLMDRLIGLYETTVSASARIEAPLEPRG